MKILFSPWIPLFISLNCNYIIQGYSDTHTLSVSIVSKNSITSLPFFIFVKKEQSVGHLKEADEKIKLSLYASGFLDLVNNNYYYFLRSYVKS
jgi:hypothetical protein